MISLIRLLLCALFFSLSIVLFSGCASDRTSNPSLDSRVEKPDDHPAHGQVDIGYGRGVGN